MNRHILLLSLLAFAALPCSARDLLPRNPFWPQGFKGRRYPISSEPRFRLDLQAVPTNEVTTASAETSAEGETGGDPTEDPIWTGAVKALHFGSTLSFEIGGEKKAAVTINGRIYAVNDLVSINHVGHRFTWRIESLSSDGKIKLRRITYRNLGSNP